jgi:hypothetical protein
MEPTSAQPSPQANTILWNPDAIQQLNAFYGRFAPMLGAVAFNCLFAKSVIVGMAPC